jgi:hypothetical protein
MPTSQFIHPDLLVPNFDPLQLSLNSAFKPHFLGPTPSLRISWPLPEIFHRQVFFMDLSTLWAEEPHLLGLP